MGATRREDTVGTLPGLTLFSAGAGRQRVRVVFVAITLFFTIWPFVSVLQSHPGPVPLALLLLGWLIFAGVLVQLFRGSPGGRSDDTRVMLPAAVALTVIALVTQVGFGIPNAAALYYYAGVSTARIVPHSRSLALIVAIAITAGIGASLAAGEVAGGLSVGVTVGTISMTLSVMAALRRTNLELHAARMELAERAVAEERSRIARDLHDTLGHSLSVIALKSELARRLLPDEPDRAASEVADVEQAARDALASVRETVTGYRQPTLAMELAGAREALRAAGIAATVEPAPEGLPRDVDALLGWAVREGVTNVLRHSEARAATIRVVTGDGTRRLEIVDDGRRREPPAGGDGRAASDGNGLAGLRERAARVGGSVDAGDLPGSGFRLRVSVPMEPSA